MGGRGTGQQWIHLAQQGGKPLKQHALSCSNQEAGIRHRAWLHILAHSCHRLPNGVHVGLLTQQSHLHMLRMLQSPFSLLSCTPHTHMLTPPRTDPRHHYVQSAMYACSVQTMMWVLLRNATCPENQDMVVEWCAERERTGFILESSNAKGSMLRRVHLR